MKMLKTLILLAGLAGASSVYSQEIPPSFKTEKPEVLELSIPLRENNSYLCVPKGAFTRKVYDYNSRIGVVNGVWYNKNCKTDDDYNKILKERAGRIPEAELFLDGNNDGIPDISVGNLMEIDNMINQLETLLKAEERSI